MSQKQNQSQPSASPAAQAPASSEKAGLSGESSEPRSDKDPIPVILFVLFAMLLFAGDMHLMANRGEFDPRVYDPHPDLASVEASWPPDPGKIERLKGRQVYEATCSACHQANGLGLPGQFPPLAGSDWALAEGPNRIIRLVLSGIQGPITVNGQSYNGAMPPWGPVLKDDQIAAAVTFVRSQWGNKASAVTADQVHAIRAEVKEREAWNPQDLLKVPDK